MRRKKAAATVDQQTQRERAWALYITEGYVANITHLEAVNAYTLNRQALAAITRAKKAAEHAASDLRRELSKRAEK